MCFYKETSDTRPLVIYTFKREVMLDEASLHLSSVSNALSKCRYTEVLFGNTSEL